MNPWDNVSIFCPTLSSVVQPLRVYNMMQFSVVVCTLPRKNYIFLDFVMCFYRVSGPYVGAVRYLDCLSPAGL